MDKEVFEKRGVIEPGRTPPEKEGQKAAAELEDCPTKRLADRVRENSNSWGNSPGV